MYKKKKSKEPEEILESDNMLYPVLPIFGFEPMSLIDFPGNMSCVLFCCGCNFKCNYCHNKKHLPIINALTAKDYEAVLTQIIRSQTSGIVITGGEPTMWGETLIQFIKWLRQFAPKLKIKLDTNGSNYALVKRIIEDKMVDFIAMDIKSDITKYNLFCDSEEDITNVSLSMAAIGQSDIAHQFRHTIYEGETEEEINVLKSLVPNLVIQKRVDRDEQ